MAEGYYKVLKKENGSEKTIDKNLTKSEAAFVKKTYDTGRPNGAPEARIVKQ